MNNVINKIIKEYFLDQMDIPELRSFLETHYGIKTDYVYSTGVQKTAIIDEGFNIEKVFDGSYVINLKTSAAVRKWYIDEIICQEQKNG